jgi:hypothetical protein
VLFWERGEKHMQHSTDVCRHLRRLRSSLTEEIRVLKETLQEGALERFDNPIETVHVIRSLQETLNYVTLELNKCSAEERDEANP